MTSTMMTRPAATTTSPAAKATATPWWKFSFTRTAWSQTLFVALAAPACLIALIDGGRFQARVTNALTGRDARTSRLRALITLPVTVAALIVVGYVASLAVLNICYPIRPLVGIPGYDPNAWGGPTYAGVWAVHALAGGVPALLIVPWLARPVAKLQSGVLGR